MSVEQHRTPHRAAETHAARGQARDLAPEEQTGPSGARAVDRLLAALRIGFGFTFLWAFLDKTFALGFHTGWSPDGTTLERFGEAAWINGGSPTAGFLTFGADGPLKELYTSIAGDAWADWLFMAGLLGIGIALSLGVGMRIAAATGALLYLLMWSVALPPQNNPLIDDHVLSAITLIALAMLGAGRTWGLADWWSRTDLVAKHPVLQ